MTNNTALITRYAYSAATNSVIDAVLDDGRLVYARGKTVEDLRAQYPDIEVLPSHEAFARADAAHIEAPKRISRAQFHEMLEVLPPLDWMRRGSSESFKISEMKSGSITSIFYRVGNTYWELCNSVRLTHDEIATLVAAAWTDSPRLRHERFFSVSYDIVTEESAEDGSTAEDGMLGEMLTLRDAVKLVTQTRTAKVDGITAVETDSSVSSVRICNGMEFETGAFETRTLHFPQNIKPTSARRLARLFGIKV